MPRRVNGTLPSGQLRNLYYGLLGPQAVSVSYRDGAAERTVPAAKATGAYLIVAPVTPGRQPDGSEVAIAPYGLLGPGRGEGLTKITYRIDGRLCERGLQSRSGAAAHVSHPCPTPPRPRRSHRPAGPDLHVPLHVRLQIAKHIVTAARVSFKAPYSVSSARAGYLFFLPQALCHRPGHFESAGNAVAFVHDVHRGGTVSTLISHPFANPGGCRLRSVMIQAVYQLGLPPRRTVIGETTIRRPPPARRSAASAR